MPRRTEPVAGQARYGPRRRRQWLAGLAMALLLVGASVGLVAAADGPGQPFYGLRLTIESLTLPPVGSAARLDAQLRMLGSRLDEAEQATQRGDQHAADDALAAVDAKLADILAETPEGADDPGNLEQGLAHAESVLTHLLQTLPAAAVPGLERALDRVNRAQEARNSGPITGPGNANQPAQAGGPANPSASPASSAQGGGPANGNGPANSGAPGNGAGSGGAANGNGPPASVGPGSTKGRSDHARGRDATPAPSPSHGAP